MILSGQGGDQVVGFGLEYLDELYQAQNWRQLKESMALFKKSPRRPGEENSEDKQQKVKSYTLRFFLDKWRKQNFSGIKKSFALGKTLLILYRYFGFSLADFFNYQRQRGKEKTSNSPPHPGNLLREDFLKQTAENDPLKAEVHINQVVNAPLNSYQKNSMAVYFSKIAVDTTEQMLQLWSAFSLKGSFPFFDSKLVELTLNVPMRLRFGKGLLRDILRQALKDYLPEKNLQRSTKAEFSGYAENAFKSLHQTFENQAGEQHQIWQIVDKNVFDKTVSLIFDKNYQFKSKTLLLNVCRVIYLAIWLDYVKNLHKKSTV